MFVYVLLYEAGEDSEGIHSLQLRDRTIVLMFENKDDAERYCGLLEAQDFPSPSIEKIEKTEIESFCKNAGYEARYVEKGFIPQTDEDRLLLTPPQLNLENELWQEGTNTDTSEQKRISDDNEKINDLRKKLEDLL